MGSWDSLIQHLLELMENPWRFQWVWIRPVWTSTAWLLSTFRAFGILCLSKSLCNEKITMLFPFPVWEWSFCFICYIALLLVIWFTFSNDTISFYYMIISMHMRTVHPFSKFSSKQGTSKQICLHWWLPALRTVFSGMFQRVCGDRAPEDLRCPFSDVHAVLPLFSMLLFAVFFLLFL